MPARIDIRVWVREHLGSLLALNPSQVDLNKSLRDLGLDSVDAVLLAGELEDALGSEIDPAAFLRSRTLEEMIASLEVLLRSQ